MAITGSKGRETGGQTARKRSLLMNRPRTGSGASLYENYVTILTTLRWKAGLKAEKRQFLLDTETDSPIQPIAAANLGGPPFCHRTRRCQACTCTCMII